MTHSVLPDREKRHFLQFHLFRAMGYGHRLVIAFGLIALGLLAQPGLPPHTHPIPWAVTLLVILCGNCLLLVRGYDLRPSHLGSDIRWERTTEEQFRQVDRLVRSVKRWDESITDISCTSGLLALLALGGACGYITVWLMDQPGGEVWAVMFAADAAVLILPHWVTGMRRGWRPVSLEQQVNAINVALEQVRKFPAPPCQIQRMFGVSGKKEQNVPVGARAFIAFPEGPENFLGLQFQVSINEVKGTQYPYLYAVLVARHEFAMLKQPAALEAGKRAGRQLTVETKREKDVDVIVIRRKTTKTSGYHTQPRHIAEIVAASWQTSAALVEGKGNAQKST